MVLHSIDVGPNLPFISNVTLANITNAGALVCY